MLSLVPRQAGFVTEAVPTLRASIWFLSSVGSLMGEKGRPFLEAFPTVGALVPLLHHILPLAVNEAGFVTEAFVVDCIVMWFVSRVDYFTLIVF